MISIIKRNEMIYAWTKFLVKGISELSESEMCHLSDAIRILLEHNKVKESKENE